MRLGKTALVLAALWLLAPASSAQETPELSPSAALSEALVAACRQNPDQFAPYLTQDNAEIFRALPSGQRTALLRRLVLLDSPGRPLLSNDAQGHVVLRCETPAVTTEMRFGSTRRHDNLAFIPVEVVGARATQFGLVREDGRWKLLSVGLLLLDLAELSKQWAAQETESGEAEIIAALRRIADTVRTYRRAFGKLPESLAQLGPAPKEGISPDAAGLLDAELAAGKKGAYVFRYRILPAAEASSEPSFELAASPAEYGKGGKRSFFLDSSGVLRGGDKHGAVATATDPRIEPQ